MKLGILADIHEHDEELRKAIDVLAKHGADRFLERGANRLRAAGSLLGVRLGRLGGR